MAPISDASEIGEEGDDSANTPDDLVVPEEDDSEDVEDHGDPEDDEGDDS